ncbi:DUF1684 domain-containing protein [Streptomyces sp. NPDC088261]|uniref:DUF1684 domain-containing protein n=1 Tax=Streptomyces sp. NPDC088261 TaxID=3365851 RepID=UPI0037FE5F25
MTTDTSGAPGTATGTDPAEEWRRWHEQRVFAVSAPYGPLSLTGTHWLTDFPGGRLPAVPGEWRADGDEVVLTAGDGDGLTADGVPLTGEIRLTADTGAFEDSRIAAGSRRLVVLRREGLWAVRDIDPGSPARRSFLGIEAAPYDGDWALTGHFRPYESRTILLPNADGRERDFTLGGEISFSVDGTDHTLQAAVEPDGSLWVVFADTTSGVDSFGFRFLRPPAPDADGTVSVDLNRAVLPPCAFADHFLCPFPPPGNRLPIAVPAGERRLVTG